MPSGHALIAFVAAAFVLLLIPGPAVLYIVNRSVIGGRGVGLAAVAGLEVGDLIQAGAAAAGLSAVIATSATAFTTIKWLGVAYLVVTGVMTMVRRPAAFGEVTNEHSARRVFRQGILVNALNPKTAMFFLSIFPQFIDPRHHPIAQSMVLGLIFVVMATLYNGSCALLASHLGKRLLRSTALPFVRRWVSGGMFLGLGVLAAAASPAKA